MSQYDRDDDPQYEQDARNDQAQRVRNRRELRQQAMHEDEEPGYAAFEESNDGRDE